MLKGSVLGHVPRLPLPLLGRWSIVAQRVSCSLGPHYKREHLAFIGPASWELDSGLSLPPSFVPFLPCTRMNF